MMTSDTRQHFVTCPLCEATCGLEITTQDRQIVAIKGDKDDVFSKGYLCPKAYSLKELHEDPDRLRQPVIRRTDASGQPYWEAVGWDDAFAEIERGLKAVIERHGKDGVGAYLGNPNVHNLAGQLYVPIFLKALGSRNLFSASSVDQLPKQLACAWMFGGGLSVPIPDIDRTDYMLILGANPLVSNGSIMTAPGMRDRLRDLCKRGGKFVVIDPVKTRTAQEADEHYFIRPGADAFFLFGLVHTLFAENLVQPGEKLLANSAGIEIVRELASAFSPETVAPRCGIEAATIRRLARELANAPRACVYGRIGTCTQEYGTLASWLVDVLNFLTGNLDREGGVMFPKGAVGARNASGQPGVGRGFQMGRWKSRVRGAPEIFGELPVATLAEEILTPGEGQIRAMVTIGGNPVLSTPNSSKLQEALNSLEFMVSVDIYLNETTRHANVVLPALSPLERSHYDIVFYQLATHNVANYTAPVFAKNPTDPDEWEIMLRLAAIVSGTGNSGASAIKVDDFAFGQTVKREVETLGSPLYERDLSEIMAAHAGQTGALRLLDFMLRSGPYGDHYGVNPDGLTLEKLKENPHGVDLGYLQPRIPEVLRTACGKIELAPAPIVADVPRLQTDLAEASLFPNGHLLLIGRRDLRSNNSWMHNLPVLAKGEKRCTLLMNPADAERLQLADGAAANVTGRVGQLTATVELTPNIMPGVVSLPHGWGHGLPGVRLSVAGETDGVNSNVLTDEAACDPVSGNAVLNGIPVTVRAN